jgi:transcriptional regulator with XRE-family HTH domain
MGYRGKVQEQEEARRLRAMGETVPDIARALGVSKSSVSLWVRDVVVEVPRPRKLRSGPNALSRRRLAEVDRLLAEGRERIGQLSDQEFLVAGAALYAGEGSKRDGGIRFANSDARMIRFFCAWLRHFFDIDESRLRLRLYLHDGLDVDAASVFWAELTGIPVSRHHRPYRAVADPTMRKSKHEMGCPSIIYSCAKTHRAVMGLVTALLSSEAIPG